MENRCVRNGQFSFLRLRGSAKNEGLRRKPRRLLAVENLERRTLLSCDHSETPHADNPVLQAEHLAVMDLVPCEAATTQAIVSGEWDNAATWDHGIPVAESNVLIPEGMSVLIDSVLDPKLRTVRIDGELSFAPNVNTALRVDTIVVTPEGVLTIGTDAAPIAPNVEARITFADRGPIDTTWDPNLLSRGLISHGTVIMHGAAKTAFVPIVDGLTKKSSRIVLASVPSGWQAGDQIVITGVASNAKQDQQLSIRSISGSVVTLDAKLRHNHTPPVSGVSVVAANLSRNVILESENSSDLTRRGHVMFMHSPAVHVDNAAFVSLGRTNKAEPLNNVQLDSAGQLIPGTGTNTVGRYPVHFHRSGVAAGASPAVIQGSVVVNSPGWGVVNHSSNVVAQDNVVFNVVGAAYVAEAGDEVGAFRHNIAIRSTGSGDPLRDREKLQDFGHTGDGFWLQAPGVEVTNNIAAGQAHAGFVYFTEGLNVGGETTRILASNLPDPSIAGGKDSVDVGAVPLRLFQGNQVFGSARGLEIWLHMQGADPAIQSVVQDLTVWGTRASGTFFGYSSQIVLKNAVILGDVRNPIGIGIDNNDGVKDITYENVRVEGFQTGIEVPLSGTVHISGGLLRNVQNIALESAAKRGREVAIAGDVRFEPLTSAALNGRIPYDVYLKAQLDFKDLDITKVFNPDVIIQADLNGNRRQLYYSEQAADQIPFGVATAPAYIPTELIGKSNLQLVQDYGLAVAGTLTPAGATTDPHIHGLVGEIATYPSHPELVSDRFTRQSTGYQLVYRLPDGRKVTDPQLVDLHAGWNVITRLIGGKNESFLVYSSPTKPLPTPEP
jgi:G8 domain